jgi:polyhydroxybutyrate depolymerase
MSASNRGTAGLFTALFVLLSLTSFACTRGVSASAQATGPVSASTGTAGKATASRDPASGQPAPSASKAAATPGRTSAAVPTTTKTYSLKAGGLTRKYEVIAPSKPLPRSAPIILTLSGIGATLAKEVPRDELVPYASTGKAEIVYPLAIGESWNAVGCCSYAAAHKVNDLAFIKALAAKVDPKHARPIDLVGYSNGARLAFRVACSTPAEFDAYAMVKGGPMPDCVVKKPTTIVQLASVDDPETPYAPGDKGREKISVLTEMARLHATDKCPAKGAGQSSKGFKMTTWSRCAGGTRLALAAWQAGKHSFPRPPVSVPAGAQVIWAFFTRSPIRALPSTAKSSR